MADNRALAKDLIQIEIAFAQPHTATIKSFAIQSGATVQDALTLAAHTVEFAKIPIMNSAVGIYGKRVHVNQLLRNGDRLEIYRSLSVDPKIARRARVKQPSA